jgi:hypothetical protein
MLFIIILLMSFFHPFVFLFLLSFICFFVSLFLTYFNHSFVHAFIHSFLISSFVYMLIFSPFKLLFWGFFLPHFLLHCNQASDLFCTQEHNCLHEFSFTFTFSSFDLLFFAELKTYDLYLGDTILNLNLDISSPNWGFSWFSSVSPGTLGHDYPLQFIIH